MPSSSKRRVRPHSAVAAFAAGASVLATFSAVAAPRAVAAPSASATGSAAVIVVLRDQLTSQPADRGHGAARKAGATSAQNAVLHRLAGPAPTHVIHYATGNAFAATVTAAQASALAADPAVASVVPDTTVQIAPPTASQAASASSSKAAGGAAPVNPAACSANPNKPLLEPEALQTINARSDNPSAATAASLGIDGTGVKVAFIADGINPANAGFTRADGTSAIVDYQDFYGDGPDAVTSGAEAFGDASAIAAQGNVTYDVADFSNPNVVSYRGGHCYIRIVGVAPGAEIVALKAGSELLPNSAILQAIDYAVNTAHVDVINESFGANLVPDSGARNTIQLFNDQAVAAGVTVTSSTGDAGITGTIGSPATDPLVISTSASTDSRLYEQTGYALATRFGNGTWADDNTSALSSAGITQAGRTADISAPGEADWAVCDDSGRFTGCVSYQGTLAKIQAFGGTSQSAPITAGVAALVIEAYRNAHGGASPTPAVVKQIIVSTSHDLGLPGEEQGSGRIDARAAVEAALTWPGATASAPAGTGQNIALSVGQLHLEGAPGSTQKGTVTVTNVGTKKQTLAPSTRDYLQVGASAQDTTLSTADGTTTPYPTTGAPWVYKKLKFTVPAGTDELRSTILWRSGAAINGAGPVVRLSVFDPSGRYEGNTRPQGGADPSNYGLITTAHPLPGTWTAVLYTAQSGGYNGTVTLDTRALRAEPAGTVKLGASSLAPGASTTLTYTGTVPAQGGDRTATVSLGSSGGHQVAIPVVERAVIAGNGGTFAGTITGGNGRAFSPAQSFGYAFDVPQGLTDLQMSLTLAKDPSTLLEGVLVDPNGEVQSVNSNELLNAHGKLVRGLSMVNTVAAPLAGRWAYVVVVQPPVSGKQLTQPFSGALSFNSVHASATPVPARIASGSSTTVTVTVRNTSPAPMVVQTDARRNGSAATVLAPQGAGSTIQLPLDVENLANVPYYLVPPDTTRVSLTASSSEPAQVELTSPPFGIDVFGDLRSAQRGSTISTATVSETTGTVGPGVWTTYVQPIGPFPAGGAPAGSSVLSATARTAPFDRDVTSSTGDPYLVTVDPSDDGGTPTVVAPGASATIRVTITPSEAAGTSVSGVLHLVSTPVSPEGAFNSTGEVLATIPYSYRVS